MILLKELREKMDTLRALDADSQIFGSGSHKYKLNPILSDQALTEFEQTHNFNIPSEYKQFISEIGDGGFGPFYGLLSLEDNEDNTVDLSSDSSLVQSRPISLMKSVDEFSKKLESCKTNDEEEALWGEREKELDVIYNDACWTGLVL